MIHNIIQSVITLFNITYIVYIYILKYVIHLILHFLEDVESMTGEIENGDLAIRDVADLLQSQYAIIAGEIKFD